MDLGSGVFVSSLATSDWQPDPEVGGEMHVLVERGDAFAGMSPFVDAEDVGPWTLPVRETILILEGAARIEIASGPTLGSQVGDMASQPKGAVDDMAPDTALPRVLVLRAGVSGRGVASAAGTRRAENLLPSAVAPARLAAAREPQDAMLPDRASATTTTTEVNVGNEAPRLDRHADPVRPEAGPNHEAPHRGERPASQ